MRFGHLTALERSDKFVIRDNYGKRYMWKCVCDCGTIVYRLPDKLRDDVDSACEECLIKIKQYAMVEKAGFVEGTQLSKITNTEPTAEF